MNDALNQIKDDPKFGESLYKAIVCRRNIHKDRADVPAHSYREDGTQGGVFCNAATVIETHHADGYAIVAVGGNTGEKLGECYFTGFPDNDESKLKVLKQLAGDLGYNVVKKPTRK